MNDIVKGLELAKNIVELYDHTMFTAKGLQNEIAEHLHREMKGRE